MRIPFAPFDLSSESRLRLPSFVLPLGLGIVGAGAVIVGALFVWALLAIFTYNTFMAPFLGAEPLALGLGLPLFLIGVFVIGRYLAFGLWIVTAILIITGKPDFGLLDMTLVPLQLFVFGLWLFVFSARRSTPEPHHHHDIA